MFFYFVNDTYKWSIYDDITLPSSCNLFTMDLDTFIAKNLVWMVDIVQKKFSKRGVGSVHMAIAHRYYKPGDAKYGSFAIFTGYERSKRALDFFGGKNDEAFTSETALDDVMIDFVSRTALKTIYKELLEELSVIPKVHLNELVINVIRAGDRGSKEGRSMLLVIAVSGASCTLMDKVLAERRGMSLPYCYTEMSSCCQLFDVADKSCTSYIHQQFDSVKAAFKEQVDSGKFHPLPFKKAFEVITADQILAMVKEQRGEKKSAATASSTTVKEEDPLAAAMASLTMAKKEEDPPAAAMASLMMAKKEEDPPAAAMSSLTMAKKEEDPPAASASCTTLREQEAAQLAAHRAFLLF